MFTYYMAKSKTKYAHHKKRGDRLSKKYKKGRQSKNLIKEVDF